MNKNNPFYKISLSVLSLVCKSGQIPGNGLQLQDHEFNAGVVSCCCNLGKSFLQFLVIEHCTGDKKAPPAPLVLLKQG